MSTYILVACINKMDFLTVNIQNILGGQVLFGECEGVPLRSEPSIYTLAGWKCIQRIVIMDHIVMMQTDLTYMLVFGGLFFLFVLLSVIIIW